MPIFSSVTTTLPSDLAESQFNMRKLVLECLVHIFLQVGWFYILDNCCLRGTQGDVCCGWHKTAYNFL